MKTYLLNLNLSIFSRRCSSFFRSEAQSFAAVQRPFGDIQVVLFYTIVQLVYFICELFDVQQSNSHDVIYTAKQIDYGFAINLLFT